MRKRGTKHGKGKGKWRIERRRVRNASGGWTYYWNRRERYVRRSKAGKRKIRYRPGGKSRRAPKR